MRCKPPFIHLASVEGVVVLTHALCQSYTCCLIYSCETSVLSSVVSDCISFDFCLRNPSVYQPVLFAASTLMTLFKPTPAAACSSALLCSILL
jgi:hypothetical protein